MLNKIMYAPLKPDTAIMITPLNGRTLVEHGHLLDYIDGVLKPQLLPLPRLLLLPLFNQALFLAVF